MGNASIQPLVSIGLPVYNGEPYLRLALDTLLNQDYPHFELIISDNASTDHTAEICREYQSRDPRIRYVRQAENIGSHWNGDFVFQQSSGEYFMWASHDDYWESSYIRKCLELLRRHPRAVLCCTDICIVDGDGRPCQDYQNIDTMGMTRVQRIHEVISRFGWLAMYGLMRPEAVRKVQPGTGVFGDDPVRLVRLLMLGDFVNLKERLFYYRIVRQKSPAELQETLDPKNKTAVPKTPFAWLAGELLRAAYDWGASSEEKVELFADFVHTLTFQNPAWRKCIADELVGPGAQVSDSAFASLLITVLSRHVPLEEFHRYPLLTAARYRVDGRQ